jgi:hypothetical protein
MTIEWIIFCAIMFVIGISGLFLGLENIKLNKENDELLNLAARQNKLSKQLIEQNIELLEELGKKESLISILRLEIEEKENKK